MKNVYLLLIAILISGYVSAQAICEQVLKEGQELFNKGKYKEAEGLFKDGEKNGGCDFKDWIEKCKEKSVVKPKEATWEIKETFSKTQDSLRETQDSLRKTRDTLSTIRGSLWDMEIELSNVQNALESEQEKFENLKAQLQAEKEATKKVKDTLGTTQQKLSGAETQNEYLTKTISTIQATYPIIINSIMFENCYYNRTVINSSETNRFKKNSIKYLYAKIQYTRALLDKPETKLTCNCKIYQLKDNKLLYIYSSDVTISPSSGNAPVLLPRWKNEKKYSKGTYRYEIWYKGVCLGEETFEIY